MATVSVVIPAFNRAHVLGRAIESVLGQTHRPDEVIVVDDGSSDATADVVNRFKNIIYLQRPQNGGAAAARNEGVLSASSKFVAFLDSDDVWHASKLERQIRCIIRDPNIVLATSGITVHERNGSIGVHLPSTDAMRIASNREWTFQDFQNYVFCPSNWVIRRSAFIEAGMFDASLDNCEDLDFLARIADRHKIVVLSEPLCTKYNLSDSLDSDLRRTSASFSVLFRRHRALWDKEPVAAVDACYRMADMHFLSGGYISGIRLLGQAISWHPTRLTSWALLLAGLLGRPVYCRARRFITKQVS